MKTTGTNELNGYKLSRQYWDFAFENPQKVSASHAGFYFWLIDLNNRLGWKEFFGLPTVHTMEALGISSYNTFRKILTDFEKWGFIRFIERSKNQFTSNIIALSYFDKALDKALDKAMTKHVTKHNDIYKQRNQETINKETSEAFGPDFSPGNDFETLAFKLWQQSFDFLNSQGIKPTSLQRAKPIEWANSIRLMVERDGRTLEETAKIIEWLPGCEFWRKNIQSTAALRKQFEKLVIEMRSKHVPGATGRVEFDSSKQMT